MQLMEATDCCGPAASTTATARSLSHLIDPSVVEAAAAAPDATDAAAAASTC